MTVGAFQFHAINPKVRCESAHDTETGILLGMPRSAMCVQRFDDSLNSAIHITYRISLRSSSMPEPRDPLLKVFNNFVFKRLQIFEFKTLRQARARFRRRWPKPTSCRSNRYDSKV